MLLSTDVAIPDGKLSRAVTEFIRDSETELLFNHSGRVYHFAALAGVHRPGDLAGQARRVDAGARPKPAPEPAPGRATMVPVLSASCSRRWAVDSL